jgi:hypothetical protein
MRLYVLPIVFGLAGALIYCLAAFDSWPDGLLFLAMPDLAFALTAMAMLAWHTDWFAWFLVAETAVAAGSIWWCDGPSPT